MVNFKQFFESYENALISVPDPEMTLEEFLKTLEGSTVRELLDKSSYMNLYLGNKYGFSDPDEADKNIKNFVNALVAFVNKDVLKHRPQNRAYDTQEFKDKHNYREYEDLDKQRRAMFRELLGKTPEQRKEIERRKRTLEDAITDTQYYKAMKAVDKEYDEAVFNYHNTPLTSRELSNDGSPEYVKLKNAYNKLIGKEMQSIDNDIIDV